MAAKDDYLIEQLVDLGYVTNEQLEPLQAEAAASGVGVIDLLLGRQMVRQVDLATAKAAHFGAEVVKLSEMRLEDEVLSAVPRHIAKRYRVVPIYRHGNNITIALSEPSDLDTIDSLHHLLKAEVTISVATTEDLEAALNKYYGAADDSVGKMIQDITEGEVEVGVGPAAGDGDDGATVDADAPIIKLVNTLIVEAFRARASDIHLEPMSKSFRVRYRIDGVLHELKSPPKRLQAAIISRLKIQSNMSIAEKRVPQDGRIQTQVGGK